MSRPRGTRNMMWFTCEDCGQRWERVHKENDVEQTGTTPSTGSWDHVEPDLVNPVLTNHSYLQTMNHFLMYYSQQMAAGRDRTTVRAEMEMMVTDEAQRLALANAIGYFHQAEMP